MGNTLQKLPQNSDPTPKNPAEQREQEQEEEEGELRPEDERNSLPTFTCEICIEPMLLQEKKFKNGNKCVHPFCTDCMIKYIRVKLEDDNVGTIQCPALNCTEFLEPVSCQSVISPELFVRWCDVLCESALLDLDRCFCPNIDCNALIVNECGGNVRKSKCPNCKNLFCFKCKTVWHTGFTCEQNRGTWNVDELAFWRLVERKKWKRCPRCMHFVEHLAGCSIIRCRCGIRFCYNCGRQSHQCRCGSTFTGFGGCRESLLSGIILICGLLFMTWGWRMWK